MSIGIIDYGMGNCGSIKNMLRYLGVESKIINHPEALDSSKLKGIILPGVGSFDYGVVKLEPFRNVLEKLVLEKKMPFMGICLGMQLLFKKSEEGKLDGLGWIEGRVKRFDFSCIETGRKLPIPHMGWNEVKGQKRCVVLGSQSRRYEDERYYFVHSFHAVCGKEEDILGTSNYGYEFVCAVHRDNIFGFQFHPEKSHKFGKALFTEFLEYSKCFEQE
ncbi:imidazole glycerol phosphate synthase subunit HisH [Enterovibrio norvegicus]|uniref:imidazole glycerol phosphate synthase subunit HisH n=1 Tax=Enterovibrio norvegicus TaxID=188144 RepID=UPI00389B1893